MSDRTLSISVVLCTWNRAPLLPAALAALLRQRHDVPYEIVLVDNGSTDDTRAIVERLAADDARLRYVFEPRPGLSHARNRGVAAARAGLITFTDDDVHVGPDWVATIAAGFETYPAAACLGGPVLPSWPLPIPAWLSPEHWAPLGVQDYGPLPLRVDHARAVCLIGANLAVRRHALDRAGPFDTRTQRVGDSPGSTEDHAFHLRLWHAGLHGMYLPAMSVVSPVAYDRLRKPHHRRWHYGHGRHIARMRLEEIERGRIRILGIPGHLVRQVARDILGWTTRRLRGDAAAAFSHEVALWHAAGFLRERWT